MTFIIKDSGKRVDYPSGMRRDVQDDKPRYDLIDRTFLKRLAEHMRKGAEKYGENNWQLANSEDEYRRFKGSAMRHLVQWMNEEDDEDHMAAVAFNLAAAEYVRVKLDKTKITAHEHDWIMSDMDWYCPLCSERKLK